ncbi:MAG TPA: ECF transporter S component [Mycobacteriales bacterium]|jgi:energy-coupling factor transport system substrate-specific component|nr:ECF transporter S component [Mycobacteriales bacterium]
MIRRAVPVHPRAAAVLIVVSLLGLAGFGWPLLISVGAAPGSSAHGADAPLLVSLLLPLLLAVVLAEVADGGIDAKAIAMLGVLVACGAGLRTLGGGLTGFNAVFFLLLPAGRVLGRGFGFVLGALTLFSSAFLTAQGFGPWLPFQMLAAGWIGFGAGCLPARLTGRAEAACLAGYALLAGLAYGVLLDLWFWPYVRAIPALSYRPGAALPDQLQHFTRFYLTTSLGFDLPRGVGMAVFVLLAGAPVLAALRRAARRASFGAVPVFEPS